MTQIVRPGALQRFVAEIFTRAGLPPDDAEWCAETLVRAELRGVTSHGVIRLVNYVGRLENEVVNPKPRVRVVKDAGALALLDGDNGMGQVVARRAMEDCLARAEAHNVGVVLLKESNHFGAAAPYASMALERNMAGLVTTNTVRVISPHGGRQRLLGNNPIAIAVPGDPPMLLDMALSAVARGYLIEAARAGREIPEGWGVDAEGRPSTDPDAILESGSLSPIAAHKGSGLSAAIDAVLGALAGGGHSHEIVGLMDMSGPSRVTHFFAALRIDALIPLPAFRAAVNALAGLLRDSPKAAGTDRIWMPGEIEMEEEERRRAEGIPLSHERMSELADLSDRYDVPPLETD